MPEFTFVDQPESLVSDLRDCRRLGVDTEFMREKTFFSELCLVQVASKDRIWCVDPLGGPPMTAFWDALLDTPGVLHSGRQDIEVIYQAAQRMPAAVFDTQIAAGLLGHPPQMGYAALVKTLFDVDIDKSHTRADWTRRPLPEAFLHYAAEDVEYLLPAHDVLSEQLERKGRLGWAEEDSAALLDPVLYDVSPAGAVDRLKGAKNLRGKRRAVAAELAAWRESEALRANRPRQWILRDSVLLELAQRQPATIAALGKIDELPPGLVRRAGDDMLAAIARAGSGGDVAPPRRPDESQKSLMKSIQQKVSARAADLGLAAETVASRRDLVAVIIDGDRNSRLLNGWRREIIGDELLGLL